MEELPSGVYYVMAEAPGWPAEYWQDAATPGGARRVTVTAPDDTGVTFFMGVGGSISGHVYETDGMTPIPGAWVSAWNYDVGGNTSSTWTDDNGFYRVLDLPSGVYGVEAYAEGRTWEVWEESLGLEAAAPVTVVAPEQTADIDFTLEMVGSISGYVYDEDESNLLPNAYVTVYDWDTGLPRGGVNVNNGFYRVDNLVVGDYYVKAVAMGRIPEYWEEAATLAEVKRVTVIALNETENINFTLRTGGSISGHVYTAESQVPIANANVIVQDFTTLEDYVISYAYTDSDGGYLLTGLPTGQYRVTAMASNRRHEFWQNASTPADADPVSVTDPDETADIDFFMGTEGSVSGHVFQADSVTPVPGATIYLTANGASESFTILPDNAGYYRFPDVIPGLYWVRAEAPGWHPEYWQEASTQDAAQVLTVPALTEMTGINFTLTFNNQDTDGDGMPDGWELKYGLNPLLPADGDEDANGDGWTNRDHYVNGTDPHRYVIVLKKGWNLIAIGRKPRDSSVAKIFGNHILGIWEQRDGHYSVPDALEPLRGYWVFAPADAEVEVLLP